MMALAEGGVSTKLQKFHQGARFFIALNELVLHTPCFVTGIITLASCFLLLDGVVVHVMVE